MYSVFLTKKLNNTELGKSGIHETYIYIPSNLDITELFPENNIKKKCYCSQTNKFYEIRLTQDQEKRIVGLGPVYRDLNVSAGDEITIERRIGCGEQYFVSVKQNVNSIVVQKLKHGFEVLTPERLQLLDADSIIMLDDKPSDFSLQFVEAIKKRADSKVATELYDIQIAGKSIAGNYTSATLIEIIVNGKNVEMQKFYGWKKIIIGDVPNE